VAPGTAMVTATYQGVSGSATVAVAAASGVTGRFVYTANTSGSVSGYLLDQATGALTAVPGSPASTSGTTPYSVTSHPSGRYVYVGTYNGITGFTSNATTGQLTSIAGSSPVFGTYASPYMLGVAVTPTGRYVYTANANTASVSAYMVDGGNGALTLIATYPTGQCPNGVTVEPAGKFVYVVTECGATQGVWGYAIDEATGALTAVSGSPFASGTATRAVAAAPNGQVLYVTDTNQQLRGYTINGTTGALTLISGFPVSTGVNTNYNGLTLDPTGRFLYAGGTSGQVRGYNVDVLTGGVTAMAGSPFSIGTSGGAYGLSIDAAGKFLYAANAGATPGTVVALAINQSTGGLTAVAGSPFAAASGPYAVTTTGAVVASAATLQSVAISPTAPTITTALLGKKQQLVLIGSYSDGTTQFLTESATWAWSPSGVATVSNAAGSKGLATSVGYGSTTITATYGTFTATATLSVVAPTVTSIAVAPSAPTIANGTAVQLTATAHYNDGSTQVVTTTATWNSDNAAAATVNTTGLVTSVAPGTAMVTATYQGVSGSATVTVQ
jgi:6-phosphogluconolactonase (cycloisomerase 2 family)